MALEHRENLPEKTKSPEQRKVDLLLLNKETIAGHLKEKYGPKYWYCQEYIAEYYKKDPASKETIENVSKFSQIFDLMKKNLNNNDFAKKLGTATNIEAGKMVRHAYDMGLSNPEQIGLIALYGLMRITESKRNPEENVSAIEMTLNRTLKTAVLPDLITKFEKLCGSL